MGILNNYHRGYNNILCFGALAVVVMLLAYIPKKKNSFSSCNNILIKMSCWFGKDMFGKMSFFSSNIFERTYKNKLISDYLLKITTSTILRLFDRFGNRRYGIRYGCHSHRWISFVNARAIQQNFLTDTWLQFCCFCCIWLMF